MTRSTQRGMSRREIFTKSIRQKAHREGILFRDALNKANVEEKLKTQRVSEELVRHHPGHGDSKAYIGAARVDDGELYLHNEDVYDFEVDFVDTYEPIHHTERTISLLDIARPAKRKGVAKDFEILQNVRHVIVLEDGDFQDVFEHWEDDGWEQVYDEEHVDQFKSYSSVLRGNER
ncbi:hypothetical protein B0H34DRAFT_103786 [Crassisporium funariophilum]|nr:hypothetical protein B0H34DRAFT_103786 [Crassisporium funariophilum]